MELADCGCCRLHRNSVHCQRGPKAGVVTDALQSVSMVVAAFVLWGVV